MTKEDKKIDPLDDLISSFDSSPEPQFTNRLQKEAEYAGKIKSNNNNTAVIKTGRKPIAQNLKQDIKKTVYLNQEQEKFIQSKAQDLGINESNYIRNLISKDMKSKGAT